MEVLGLSEISNNARLVNDATSEARKCAGALEVLALRRNGPSEDGGDDEGRRDSRKRARELRREPSAEGGTGVRAAGPGRRLMIPHNAKIHRRSTALGNCTCGYEPDG